MRVMGYEKGRGEALHIQGSSTEGGILVSGQSYIVSFPSKLVQFVLGFFFCFVGFVFNIIIIIIMKIFDSDLQAPCVIFSIFIPKAGMQSRQISWAPILY